MPIRAGVESGVNFVANNSLPTGSGINDALTNADIKNVTKKVRETMDKAAQYLISKDNGNLQIPYGEYIILMEKAEEAKRIRKVKDEVLAQLDAFLDGSSVAVADANTNDKKESIASDAVQAADAEEMKEPAAPVKAETAPAAQPVAAEKTAVAKARVQSSDIEVPPIKKEIEKHFNKVDESGRLLNVFRQYYTCLNDACGSTVRVTMKDGFCSLWNYDEWEEFAFVDIFEGNLRFAVDPRYTDALSSLSICAVPRLLSSRRNLVCVQVGDLNTTMLNVLVKAFEEVGMTAS
jgi:hypothetical protein